MRQRQLCFPRPDSLVPWPVAAHTPSQGPASSNPHPGSQQQGSHCLSQEPQTPRGQSHGKKPLPRPTLGSCLGAHVSQAPSVETLFCPLLGKGGQTKSFICSESEFIWHPLITLYYSVTFPFPHLLRSPQTPWESGSTLCPLPSNTIPWMPLLWRRCISAQPWAPKHQPMKLCWLRLKSLPPSGAFKPQALSIFAGICNARVSCLEEKRLHTVEEVKYRSPGVGLQLLISPSTWRQSVPSEDSTALKEHLGESSEWSHLLRKSHHPDPCPFIPLISAFLEPPSTFPRVPRPVTIQNLSGRNNCFLHWNNIDNHTYLLCQVWNSCLSFPPTYPMPTALELLWNTIWEKSSSQIFEVSIHKKAKKKKKKKKNTHTLPGIQQIFAWWGHPQKHP